jgi:protein-S-isoprenylcysteine O-methyltransferase Ste14
MYFGMLLAYAGLFIFLQTPWFVIILPILAWTLTRMVIVPEENYLQQKFGDEYMQYKSRVPRWI